MSYGDLLSEFRSDEITDAGELLTVTRPSTGATQSIMFSVLPIGIDGLPNFQMEGSFNSGDDESHLFVAAGTADVRDADRITYNSVIYRVLSALPRRVSGVNVSMNCVATKEGLA